MAKWWDNFSSYSIEATPSGYTKRWQTSYAASTVETGTGLGSKQLKCIYNMYDNFRMFSLNAMDSDADKAKAEILIKAKSSINNSSYPCMLAGVRASGTYGSENMYCATLDGSASNQFKIQYIVSGMGSVQVKASTNFSWSANTWYWIRMRANGTALSAKVWADGTTEPSSWTLTATDNNITAGGWVGHGSYANATLTVDAVSIASNGDTALKPPVISSDNATTIFQTGATMNGNLTDIGGENCTRFFEWGTTTAYGTVVALGSGATGAITSDLTGLDPNTTYHYRAYATNTAGTTYGVDRSFTTLAAYKPSSLSPNTNAKLNPLVDNTFTWSKDAGAIQTSYELNYREVGSGTWLTTGTITSSTLSCTLAANTLLNDKSYEWRVKSWDSAHPTWYDWSATSPTFNTINPPSMSNVSLADGADLQLGILNISATGTSVYGRSCKVVVTVADNVGFTGSVSYESNTFSSGSTGIAEVPFGRTGTYYVKVIIEDSTGLQTYETKTVDVIRTLHFIDEPSVKLQGPQATHVTVRIKGSSPVVEYTAHITPEPTSDKWVERLIEIDTGTVTTCQAVAEQLITRWGREQRSISGEINLTVTLSFLEKIHIIDPQSGIDDEFILQQKEHNVTDMTTKIVVGDIILDNGELLARILDKLKK